MTRVSVEQVYEAAVKQVGGFSGSSGSSGFSRSNQTNLTHVLDGVTVFLDRDGTLNYDSGYIKSSAELRLLPGVTTALARLKTAGARLVVVTNQSGVSQGLLTLKDLEAIHARLQGILEQEDAALDAIYFCPHHPDDGCRCRKPGTGMVERAISELQLDLKRSYVVGDHIRDVQLARNVGAKAILLASGPVDAQALETLKAEQAEPNVIVISMAEAVEWIFADATTLRP